MELGIIFIVGFIVVFALFANRKSNDERVLDALVDVRKKIDSEGGAEIFIKKYLEELKTNDNDNLKNAYIIDRDMIIKHHEIRLAALMRLSELRKMEQMQSKLDASTSDMNELYGEAKVAFVCSFMHLTEDELVDLKPEVDKFVVAETQRLLVDYDTEQVKAVDPLSNLGTMKAHEGTLAWEKWLKADDETLNNL